MNQNESFNCVHSCDIKANLSIKIGSLEGVREKPCYKEILKNPVLQFSGCNQDCSDLTVECYIYGEDRFLTLPVITPYKAFTTRWNWNEWLEFPIRFCDLPRKSILLMNIYDYEAPRKKVLVGGTSISLFGEYGLFPKGLIDLRVWPGQKAHPSQTPGMGPLTKGDNDQMYRLNNLVKKHETVQVPRVDWLDRLVFREIELINDKQKKSSNFMYLMIEFPKVEIKDTYYHIIWWENASEPDNYFLNKYYKGMVFYDPDIGLENLHESKHHHLTRSLQSGVTDKDLKPNSTTRDLLLNILQYPPTRQLTSDEQDLIWKYRFFLSYHKKGLPKFLKCVNWNLAKEGKQAIALLHDWAPPDAHDALELLGPEFTNPDVRKYAVNRLSNANDEELLLYLLQLVQALKYEVWEVKEMNLLDFSHYSLDSETGAEASNFTIEPLTSGSCVRKSIDSSHVETSSEKSVTSSEDLERENKELILEGNPFGNSGQDLASFLIRRSCKSCILASYFYWYLLVECEEKGTDQGPKPESKVREMYLWVMSSFKTALQQWSPQSQESWQTILRQQRFVDSLFNIMQTISKETSGRLKKIEKLQSLLADPQLNLVSFESLPLPLNPEVQVCGVIPERATLFKSALEPCRLSFKTSDNKEYITIFKCGDDLRQDQLIIQIITLMDKLLLNENMDLKLTPYKVLATSSKHGFVQYIDSISVAEVLRTEGSLQNFFRSNAPCETGPNGISPHVMDTFIRSCAGYCVITYILGIGDRHFDNLLLTRDGHFFHIDFGYILGRDPKPLPPPMKLTKEMVEAMGGQASDYYNEFRRLCYTTFMQLRRHSALVLNLFSLMVDASVPDIALEPDKTARKIEDRFCMSLGEEEAVAHVQDVIDASVGAVVAVVVEQFHRLAQFIRK